MAGRWLSVKSMDLSGKRAQLTLQTPDGWVFTHEERHHLPSSQVADWQLSLWWWGGGGEGGGKEAEIDFVLICHSQAHALPQFHLWARSLWLWGEGFVVSNIGGLGE